MEWGRVIFTFSPLYLLKMAQILVRINFRNCDQLKTVTFFEKPKGQPTFYQHFIWPYIWHISWHIFWHSTRHIFWHCVIFISDIHFDNGILANSAWHKKLCILSTWRGGKQMRRKTRSSEKSRTSDLESKIPSGKPTVCYWKWPSRNSSNWKIPFFIWVNI